MILQDKSYKITVQLGFSLSIAQKEVFHPLQ